MKLSNLFLVHGSGDNTVLVPTGAADFSGVVRGNKTLGAILDLLSEDISYEELVSALCLRFDAPREVIEKDVSVALEKLRGIGALEE